MSFEIKKFILKITIATLIIVFIGWIVFSYLLPAYYLEIFPVVLLFFYFFTLLIHSYQLNLAKKDMGKFTRQNMLMTFFKLVVYSLFTIIYVANNKENAISFVIVIMALYLVFTTLEVSDLMRIVRILNKSK